MNSVSVTQCVKISEQLLVYSVSNFLFVHCLTDTLFTVKKGGFIMGKGFTLIEMVLVIAVIAILVLAIQGGAGVRQTARVQSAAESVRALRSAAEAYIANGKLTFEGISVSELKTQALLPSGFNATGTNPWGGSYNVCAKADDVSKLEISLGSVSASTKSKLDELFKNSAESLTYANNTWTAIF